MSNIYIIALNPSLDYYVVKNNFNLGGLNLAEGSYYLPGSKGINVALMLNNLSKNSTLFGFLDEHIGSIIKNKLVTEGIDFQSTVIADTNRINIKLKTINEETEITGLSPNITLSEQALLLKQLSNIKEKDIIVLSGSLPRGLSDAFYAKIILALPKSVKVFLDCKGVALKLAIKQKPYLVKPNIHELEDYFGCNIPKEEIIIYAKKLLAEGAENVIVSLGKEGAIFVNNEVAYVAKPVQGELISSVGAGDSMVAGFIYGFVNNFSLKECFHWAAACGTATAYSLGIAKIDAVKDIYKKTVINEL